MAMNLHKLTQNPTRVRNIIILLAVVIGGGALWYYQVFVPRQAEAKRLEAEHKLKNDKLQRIILMKPKRNQLSEEIAQKRQSLDSLRAMFPDNKEIPRLIH